MISPGDIVRLWPDAQRFQLAVLLAQELASLQAPCGGCDNSHMELPARDCCVYDKAYRIVDKIEQLEKERTLLDTYL
jgi:hypothetical protein